MKKGRDDRYCQKLKTKRRKATKVARASRKRNRMT
jgi:hypothetical protein